MAHLLFTQLPRAQVFSETRARQRSVAPCLWWKGSPARQVAARKGALRSVNRRQRGRRPTVDRGVQRPRHASGSGRPGPRLRSSRPRCPRPPGLGGLDAVHRPFVEAFPDLRLTVEDIFSVGEKVAARVAFHGTHRSEFQGIPPTSKEVAFSSIEVNRVVGGKVEEHWVELDLLGLMQQLGILPEPEQSEEASPT